MKRRGEEQYIRIIWINEHNLLIWFDDNLDSVRPYFTAIYKKKLTDYCVQCTAVGKNDFLVYEIVC